MSEPGAAPSTGASGRSPLGSLGVLASSEAMLTPALRHLELFTPRGLLTLLWHQPAQTVPPSPLALICGGGAMGGLLGPGEGLYQLLGERLAERGLQTLRVGYRRPNDLDACCVDLAAAAQLASAAGASRIVTLGHSFGGAVAVRVAVAFPEFVAGVVTFATQSAGCEVAAGLQGRPLLMFHGTGDELIPLQSSEVVRAIAGSGELVVLEEEGHLLATAGPQIWQRLATWLPAVGDPDLAIGDYPA